MSGFAPPRNRSVPEKPHDWAICDKIRPIDAYASHHLTVSVLLWGWTAYGQPSPDGGEFFEKKIRPLLASKCYVCHGEKLASSGLRLDFKAGWKRGGNRGTAIVPGDPDGSLLIKAISFRDPQLKMPPGGRLSAAEIADLSEWVRTGAPDPRAT